MSTTEEFERDKTCYEQNCEHMRSLNQIMWQVPMIAMTLTGGLWYAVVTISGTQTVGRVALLLFAVVSNIGLTLMINRVRDILDLHLQKMREFNPSAFVDASATSRSIYFLRNRGVCRTFSVLMLTAAVFSAIGLVLIVTDVWNPAYYNS